MYFIPIISTITIIMIVITMMHNNNNDNMTIMRIMIMMQIMMLMITTIDKMTINKGLTTDKTTHTRAHAYERIHIEHLIPMEHTHTHLEFITRGAVVAICFVRGSCGDFGVFTGWSINVILTQDGGWGWGSPRSPRY